MTDIMARKATGPVTGDEEERNGDGHDAMSAIRGLIRPEWPGVQLDDVDRRLLMLLDQDSSRSQRSLATSLGISAPTVGERLARLSACHVIEGRGLRVDWSAIGYPLLVIMPIIIDRSARIDLVADALRGIPELTELILLSGPYDMLARFQVRSYSHLRSLLLDKVWPLPGLRRAETMISLGTLMRRGPLEVAFATDTDANDATGGDDPASDE